MPTVTSSVVYDRTRRGEWNLGVVGAGTSTTLNPITLTSSKAGGENPRWRSQMRQHIQAGTGFSASKQTYRGGYGQATGYYHIRYSGVPKMHWNNVTGFLTAVSLPSIPGSSGRADNDARMRFYKRAKQAQTAFRALTTAGEMIETLRMLRNPARALRSGLDTYVKSVTKRTRRVKKRQALNRIVGETWLEYVFGWAPLISDVRSAGEALNQRLERYRGNYATIVGTGEEKSYTESGWGAWVQHHINRWRTRTGTFSVQQVRYLGEIRSVCPNPVAADLQLFGLNWREVVPTAWELIPYSFLVDYFTNIGDVLDAWSFRRSDQTWTVRTERLWGLRRTVQTESILYLTGYGNVSADPRGHTFSCSNASATNKTVVRSLPDAMDIPSFEWTIPGFGKKWVNMTALANARRSYRKQIFR